MLDNGIVIPIFGEQIEVLVTKKDSNNILVVPVQTCPPSGEPPPRRQHREEEVFTGSSGECELFNGMDWTPLQASTTALSPRGHHHAFRDVGRAYGKLMFFTNGGGLDDDFELISSMKFPDDMQQFKQISSHFN